MNYSTFLLEPAHAGFLNGGGRKLRYMNRKYIISIVLGALFLIPIGLWIVYFELREQGVRGRLDQYGISGAATITDQFISRGGSDGYYLIYSYEAPVNGTTQTYKRDEYVSYTVYHAHPVGQTVTIWYLPDDPVIARLTDNPYKTNYYVLIAIAVIIWQLINVFRFIRAYRRDRLLEQEGRVITGSVTKSRLGKKDRTQHLFLEYEFLSPQGTTVQGKQDHARQDLDPEHVPEPGTKIAIVYQNDQIFRAL
jgi:hypothetical protein